MAKKKLVMTEIARRILHTRKKLKLTQTDVAEYCGVDRVSVSGWERGSMPKADNFQKLTELFKVDANWLLSGENSGAIESHQNEKQLENFKSSNPPRFLQINLYHEESSLAGSYNLPLSALSKEQIPHSHISCFELQSNNLEPVMPSGTICSS